MEVDIVMRSKNDLHVLKTSEERILATQIIVEQSKMSLEYTEIALRRSLFLIEQAQNLVKTAPDCGTNFAGEILNNWKIEAKAS